LTVSCELGAFPIEPTRIHETQRTILDVAMLLPPPVPSSALRHAAMIRPSTSTVACGLPHLLLRRLRARRTKALRHSARTAGGGKEVVSERRYQRLSRFSLSQLTSSCSSDPLAIAPILSRLFGQALWHSRLARPRVRAPAHGNRSSYCRNRPSSYRK
jgi:hypothetical protein